MVVKGKTKSGYSFAIDSRIKDDRRLLKATAVMQSATDPTEQLKGIFMLEKAVLGSDEEIEKLEPAIASKNDGFVSNDAFYAEINEIIEALNAKN